ncbi:MAG: archaellin/type IV pilin N-terminal domain-containing protein [Pyrodictiaceae archaeon]
MQGRLRGLSPIVSVVLLILIAVAASVLIYTWMSGLATSSPASEPALQERIKIDSIRVATNTSATTYKSNVTIYVRNLGSIAFKPSGAFIYDVASGTEICSNTTSKLASITVKPGYVEEVVVNCEVALTSGKAYRAIVVTERGSEASYLFTAP